MDTMPILLKLVVVTMAAWQIVETFRHGSIFACVRQWGNRQLASKSQLVRKVAKLTVCAFCLSHWSPILPLFVMFYGPIWARFLVVALAITRTSQLLNDLSYSYSRSPPSGEEIVIDETEE